MAEGRESNFVEFFMNGTFKYGECKLKGGYPACIRTRGGVALEEGRTSWDFEMIMFYPY